MTADGIGWNVIFNREHGHCIDDCSQLQLVWLDFLKITDDFDQRVAAWIVVGVAIIGEVDVATLAP